MARRPPPEESFEQRRRRLLLCPLCEEHKPYRRFQLNGFGAPFLHCNLCRKYQSKHPNTGVVRTNWKLVHRTRKVDEIPMEHYLSQLPRVSFLLTRPWPALPDSLAATTNRRSTPPI